jgi:CheY-specific phosphatase CheX
MLENLRQTVISVVSNVFETMFFLTLELQEEGWAEGMSSSIPSSTFFRGEIGFHGRQSGRLRLYLPSELAKAMATNFLGLEEGTATESQTQDMVSELCNVVCGNLLSQLDRKTVWDLSLPRTLPISSSEIKKEDEGSGIMLSFNTEGDEVRVNIQIE